MGKGGLDLHQVAHHHQNMMHPLHPHGGGGNIGFNDEMAPQHMEPAAAASDGMLEEPNHAYETRYHSMCRSIHTPHKGHWTTYEPPGPE